MCGEFMDLEGFKRPVTKEVVLGYWQLFDSGEPLSLIPELLQVSHSKAMALRAAGIPERWREEYEREWRV